MNSIRETCSNPITKPYRYPIKPYINPNHTSLHLQLAMHSIREMCGVADIAHAYNHFAAFFQDFTAIDATLDMDSVPPADIRGVIDDVPCDCVKAA